MVVVCNNFCVPLALVECSTRPTSKKLEFSLHCSVNMLEGDTGYISYYYFLPLSVINEFYQVFR